MSVSAWCFIFNNYTLLLLFFKSLLPSVFVSLQQSLAETQHLHAKVLASPTQEAAGFLLKDSNGAGGSSKNSSSCDTDDFVIVPAPFTSKAILPWNLYTSDKTIKVIAYVVYCCFLFCFFHMNCFPAGELTSESKVLQDSLMNSGWDALTILIMSIKCPLPIIRFYLKN